MSKDDDETVKPAKPMTEGALKKHLKYVNDAKTSGKEMTGGIGPATKEFCEKHGAHGGALGDLAKIDRMSDTKRQDYLRTFAEGFILMAKRWGASDTLDLFDAADDDRKTGGVKGVVGGTDVTKKPQAAGSGA